MLTVSSSHKNSQKSWFEKNDVISATSYAWLSKCQRLGQEVNPVNPNLHLPLFTVNSVITYNPTSARLNSYVAKNHRRKKGRRKIGHMIQTEVPIGNRMSGSSWGGNAVTDKASKMSEQFFVTKSRLIFAQVCGVIQSNSRHIWLWSCPWTSFLPFTWQQGLSFDSVQPSSASVPSMHGVASSTRTVNCQRTSIQSNGYDYPSKHLSWLTTAYFFIKFRPAQELGTVAIITKYTHYLFCYNTRKCSCSVVAYLIIFCQRDSYTSSQFLSEAIDKLLPWNIITTVH